MSNEPFDTQSHEEHVLKPLAPAGMPAFDALDHNLRGETLSPWDLPQARIPAGGSTKWRLTTGEDVDAFEGVVLLIGRRRAYWASAVPSGSAPDCVSMDGIVGHGTPGGQCATCPHNQWGTSLTSKGKACREMRCLLVMPTDSTSALPLVVMIAPASLAPWRQYLLGLAARRLRYDSIVTKFSLKTVSKNRMNFCQAQFTIVRSLNPEELNQMREVALSFAASFGAFVPQNGNHDQ